MMNSGEYATNMRQRRQRPFNGRGNTKNRNNSHPLRRTALQERLEQCCVLELTADGGREFHTMTLRDIYDYVIKSITHRLKSGPVHPDNNTVGMNGTGAGTGAGAGNTLTSPPQLIRPFNKITSPSQSQSQHHLKTQPLLPSLSETDSTGNTQQRLPHQQQQQQQQQQHDHTVTYRERLGGYLHPRDMRRLVTPFSTSNEPELMVRRHVMLLNFDPLRAIVLRDRMLLLVPDGADSILISLERRVRGGFKEWEKQCFGSEGIDVDIDIDSGSGSGSGSSSGSVLEDKGVIEGLDGLEEQTFGNNYTKNKKGEKNNNTNTNTNTKKQPKDDDDDNVDDELLSYGSNNTKDNQNQTINSNDTNSSSSLQDDYRDNEWDDIEGMNWIEMPFELQSLDAVLSSVVKMLIDDSSNLKLSILDLMEKLRNGGVGGGVAAPGDHTQEKLRLLKDEVKEMESRVQGFVRAINQILDDDEDMALMNLSRIVTHPERFIQPVSQEVLNEESDEPELILEAYLQQALSEVNALELLKGQILNTEELVSLQMDTIRNRLLYVNTMVSLISLSVAVASMIGSIFGMNLINHLEDDEQAFTKVVTGTVIGMFSFLVCFVFFISRFGLLPSTDSRK